MSRLRSLAAVGAAALFTCAIFAPSQAAEMQEKTLRVGATFLPPARGNPYRGIGSPSVFTWHAMFDSLTFVDDTGSPTPALGASWKNTSPTTWEVTLKPNLVFWNGETVTPEGVAELTAWVVSDEGEAKGPSAYASMSTVASARALDARTVEFTTHKPDPILPARLAAMPILAPKAFFDMGIDQFAQTPVATGSYKLVSWSGEKAILTANETSWRLPKIRDLEVFEVPERSARAQAFISGQLEIAVGFSVENVQAIRDAGHVVDSVISPQTLTIALVLNNAGPGIDNEPLQDKRVRQAMNYAVDNITMAREFLGDEALAASMGIVPIANGYNPDIEPYPYDPEKARQLLAEAGYADGFDVKFEVIPGAFPADNEIFQLMAQQLNEVGIRTELQIVSFADWLKKFYSVGWEGQGFETTWDVAPQMDAMKGFVNQTCGFVKPYYCDERTIPMIEKIDAEFDPDKRRAMLQELSAFYHEEASQLFLTYIVDITGVSNKIRGFRNTARHLNYHKIEFVE